MAGGPRTRKGKARIRPPMREEHHLGSEKDHVDAESHVWRGALTCISRFRRRCAEQPSSRTKTESIELAPFRAQGLKPLALCFRSPYIRSLSSTSRRSLRATALWCSTPSTVRSFSCRVTSVTPSARSWSGKVSSRRRSSRSVSGSAAL